MAADKLLARIPGTANPSDYTPTQIGGASYANKVLALNAAGQLDQTMMPTGIGAPTATGTANSALTAGQFVNITGGTVKVADASVPLKANGFVLSGYASAATGVVVYLSGQNTAVTGLTPGPVYLGTNGAAISSTTGLVAGNIAQFIGDAITATDVDFQPAPPITVA